MAAFSSRVAAGEGWRDGSFLVAKGRVAAGEGKAGGAQVDGERSPWLERCDSDSDMAEEGGKGSRGGRTVR